jgi:LPS export ABC transporter protein LptC
MKLHRCVGTLATIAMLGIGGCRQSPQPKPTPTPKPAAIEAKLELNNLSFEQVDNQGKLLWKVRAERGVYTPDRKRASVTKLAGELYQDGKIIMRITANTGEVEQAGEKVILRGDVVTKETRNQLVVSGQEVEWQPKLDLLTIRDRVRANQPKLQVQANEGKYRSRTQQLDLTGKIVALSPEPKVAMQTEHLTWLVKDQKIIGDRPTQMQRYRGETITDRATAGSFSSALDLQIINLQRQVQLNVTKPLIQVNGESFAWDLRRELISADRPLKIVHSQEGVTFTADAGTLDLKGSIATLDGNATGIATRNQAKLNSDRLTWEIASQQIVGTGNVVYQQTDPAIKFTGSRGVGKLQDRSIVISSDGKRRVRTDFIPQ